MKRNKSSDEDILIWSEEISIGLQYQVYLNFYVIYRSNMICKWTLDIFGNLIAHWLLASQIASPLMPG